MTQCPLGHPPGPQPFCPICGRATVPVPDVQAGADPGAAGAAPAHLAPPAPGPETQPGEDAGPPSYEPTPPVAQGPAAEDARRLIDELTGGAAGAPSSTSWGAGPSVPSQESGVPSYAPQPPATPEPPHPAPLPGGLPPAMTASQPVLPALPAEPAPRAAHGAGHGAGHQDHADERSGSSRLLPLLLALVLLLGGGYLVKSLLLDGDDDEGTLANPPVRTSATASPRPPAASPPTYTPAQVAAALQDPHFRHGYDAGRKKAAAGAVSDPEATCREMGLQERTAGYPWGAHDRQGCLVGLTAA